MLPANYRYLRRWGWILRTSSTRQRMHVPQGTYKRIFSHEKKFCNSSNFFRFLSKVKTAETLAKNSLLTKKCFEYTPTSSTCWLILTITNYEYCHDNQALSVQASPQQRVLLSRKDVKEIEIFIQHRRSLLKNRSALALYASNVYKVLHSPLFHFHTSDL